MLEGVSINVDSLSRPVFLKKLGSLTCTFFFFFFFFDVRALEDFSKNIFSIDFSTHFSTEITVSSLFFFFSVFQMTTVKSLSFRTDRSGQTG